MSLHELVTVIKKHLTVNGNFALLLPYHRKDEFEKIALTEGFYLEEEVSVKQTPVHDYFRVMLLFGRNKIAAQFHFIIIREQDQYTATFTDLLKDYYLKL